MEKMQLFKRRDFGAILNDSTQFITQNFRSYSKAFLYFVVPLLLLLLVGGIYLYSSFEDISAYISNPKGYILRLLTTSGPVLLLMFIIFSAVYIIQSLLAYEYVLLYEEKENPDEISTTELWERIRINIGRMIWSYLGLFGMVVALMVITVFFSAALMAISGVLGGIVYIILIFGWLYFFIPISLFFMVRLREGTGIVESLQRCFSINRGYWWRTLGLMFVVGIVAWALKMLFVAPFSIADWIITSHYLSSSGIGPGRLTALLTSIQQSLSLVVGLYFSVLTHFVTAFNYYSLVEQTDHTGLKLEIETIGEKKDPALAQEGEF